MTPRSHKETKILKLLFWAVKFAVVFLIIFSVNRLDIANGNISFDATRTYQNGSNVERTEFGLMRSTEPRKAKLLLSSFGTTFGSKSKCEFSLEWLLKLDTNAHTNIFNPHHWVNKIIIKNVELCFQSGSINSGQRAKIRSEEHNMNTQSLLVVLSIPRLYSLETRKHLRTNTRYCFKGIIFNDLVLYFFRRKFWNGLRIKIRVLVHRVRSYSHLILDVISIQLPKQLGHLMKGMKMLLQKSGHHWKGNLRIILVTQIFTISLSLKNWTHERWWEGMNLSVPFHFAVVFRWFEGLSSLPSDDRTCIVHQCKYIENNSFTKTLLLYAFNFFDF